MTTPCPICDRHHAGEQRPHRWDAPWLVFVVCVFVAAFLALGGLGYVAWLWIGG